VLDKSRLVIAEAEAHDRAHVRLLAAFRYALWREAAQKSGFEIGSAARDFTEAFELPWSHGNIQGKNRAQARSCGKNAIFINNLRRNFPSRATEK
jgi:hypothetical protein